MISITVPGFVRKVADEYKSTQEMDFGNLCKYFSMCLFGLENLCKGARCFLWSPSVSTLNKYLIKFYANQFIRRLLAKVLRKIKENKIDLDDCCYVIDDTITEKYGEKIFRIESWGQLGGGMIRGQRIMTLALVIKSKGIAIPLAFEFCPKKEEEYRSSLKISVKLIDSIFSQGFPNLPIAFDSWFDSVDLMKDLSNRKITFVIEIFQNLLLTKHLIQFLQLRHTSKKLLPLIQKTQENYILFILIF